MKLKLHDPTIDLKIQNPNVLITGDGRSLSSDLDTFLSWEVPHDVMAIGRSINIYPGIVKHWANVDGTDSSWWAEHLPQKNDGKIPIRHTLGKCKEYDVDWDIVDSPWKMDEIVWYGSTSLFAVYVSLELGYDKIILAGCPLDNKGHWYFPDRTESDPRWHGETFQVWLDFARDERAKRVRSLSGYTGQIIGLGTKEWIIEPSDQ